jgi:hypothetical protein
MPGRGNGRHAASYTPLVDLDPQLADAVLHVLGDEGIAAYAAPVSDHRPLTELPARTVDRPLDRVYVDASAATAARRVVDAHLPDLVAELEEGHRGRVADQAPSARDLDEDAAWAAIVAGYEQTTTDPVPRWPVAEDLPNPEEERRRGRLLRAASFDDVGTETEAGEPEASPAAAGADQSGDATLGHRGYTVREPDEHFVPPTPPPFSLPADPITRAAWISVIGGPLLFLLAALLGWHLEGWVALVAVTGFVGGFVTLVARMKDRPPPDSGYDDGAVV